MQVRIYIIALININILPDSERTEGHVSAYLLLVDTFNNIRHSTLQNKLIWHS